MLLVVARIGAGATRRRGTPGDAPGDDRGTDRGHEISEGDRAMTATTKTCEEQLCSVCHCTGEGCDGTVCHGLDAD